MRILIIIALIIASSCGQSKSGNLRSDIQKFDEENTAEITMLCNSLIKIIGKDKSYVMEVASSNEENRFKNIDSLGKLDKSFYTGFIPSQSQLAILSKAGAISLNFNKKAQIFYTTLHFYTSDDETITMYLYYGSKPLSAKKTLFYEKGNRKYILAKN